MLQYRPAKQQSYGTDTQTMAPVLDPAARREHRRRNLQQSALLITGIGAVVAVAAWLIWGAAGVVVCFLVIGVVTALAPRVPPEVAMRLYRAQRVAPSRWSRSWAGGRSRCARAIAGPASGSEAALGMITRGGCARGSFLRIERA
jgi:hypothetical protein